MMAWMWLATIVMTFDSLFHYEETQGKQLSEETCVQCQIQKTGSCFEVGVKARQEKWRIGRFVASHVRSE